MNNSSNVTNAAASLLVTDSFLKAFKAYAPAAYSAHMLLESYPKLLEFGWSQADTEMAMEMGYPLTDHVVWSEGQDNWRYGTGAQRLHQWARNRYQQYKAEEVGMSFEDFVALWRSFADVSNRPTINCGGGDRITP